MTVNKVLSAVAAAMAAAIILTTAAAFALKRAHPGSGLRDADPPSERASALRMSADGRIVPGRQGGATLASFTGLGQIRAATAPEADGTDGVTVVVVPWLAYIDGDTAFYEELSRKSSVLKGLMGDYFSSRTAAQLRQEGEAAVKAALLRTMNGRLVLGQIQAIYFTDYLFLE
ncbi:MAG: hypothetical protein K2H09_00235 [Treponemataceae bacterium]|nr:hypothetical protein [Treponemataceae bacterium]